MAYVRQHGNQLAIVSGERDKETGSVQQRVLFTFYSKDEAKAAIGTGTENRKSLFQNLMCKAYPGSKFDWEKINQAIEQKLDILPEKYESRTAECSKDLSSTIKALVKDIVLADPYLIPSARAV